MIDPAEATDPEILAAVEAWARARGYWLARPGIDPDPSGPWAVTPHPFMPGRVSVILRASASPTGRSESWDTAPLVALAWALAVEADERVDVGRCPACVKRGGPWEWWQKWESREWSLARLHERLSRYGWDVRRALITVPKRKRPKAKIVGSRPCPDCNGTGRDTREAARLVLDAAPVRHEERNLGTWWMASGDPTSIDALSIDALTVHAERLMLTTLPDAPGEPVVSPAFASHKEAREWAAANAMPGDTFEVHRSRDPRNLQRPEHVAEVRRADHRPAARARIELGELLALYLHRWSTGDGREGTAEAVRRALGTAGIGDGRRRGWATDAYARATSQRHSKIERKPDPTRNTCRNKPRKEHP